MSALWDWLGANWGWIYGGGAVIVGALSALATFIGIWWYASAEYALGGLVLGWIPGAVAGGLAGLILGFGWPLILGGLLLCGDPILNTFDRWSASR